MAFRNAHGDRFRLRGQNISVITYTNAACDEILRRLDYDPIIRVSTIHSFVWELIKGFNADIREWLRESLAADILELNRLIEKSKSVTKTSLERERSLKSKTTRLAGLDYIKSFTYSPTGDNRTRDSLNHSEVIQMGAAFLNQKSLMQKLAICASPFILVDESQDTNRELIEALLSLQRKQATKFGLGLFGDMMQRIYADGKSDLDQDIPADWSTPEKTINFRCPKRVIRLINQIRQASDGWQQVAHENAPEGHTRFFIVPSYVSNKELAEKAVQERMVEITGDLEWNDVAKYKALILEHHMAARRLGFLDTYEPLAKVNDFSTGLREGTIEFLRFYSDQILPLVDAQHRGDAFATARIVRKFSPLMSLDAFRQTPHQQDQLAIAKAAVEELAELCATSDSVTFQQALDLVARSNLFRIPEKLFPYVTGDQNTKTDVDEDALGDRVLGIREFLKTPFSQIRAYAGYVYGLSRFGTHQGVKGLEFPRVMVLMDDSEARGFMFSYDKLFGVKEHTKTDIENRKAGKETSVDRTRRLLYVTCSRSESSLALVAYTSNPVGLKSTVTKLNWFEDSEVEQVDV
ncbi:hypothetical protein HOV93_40340 [Planctomycetes bacterium FF15]|uniref:DNA 3'-5' helicase II n=1 Tax=Bremerella alba TaxID=980252 RepID=A0A7V9A971_9BACT|nr:hypothetical protein [Bremerella alba]